MQFTPCLGFLEQTEKIDGVNISREPEYKRAKYIGRVFQDPMRGTAANMEIQENLAMALRRGIFCRSGFLHLYPSFLVNVL